MTLRRASQLAKLSSMPNPSGAVFTRDEVVIAGGYSLVPDRLIESQTELSGLQVALALAIKSGVSLDKSKLCVTHGFNEDTAKLLILAGVRWVESYSPCTEDAIELLEDAQIEFEVKVKKRTTK